MKTKLLQLIILGLIFLLPSCSFCQPAFPEPEKALLVKNKIKKYDLLKESSHNDIIESSLSTFRLNELGNELSISYNKKDYNVKTIFEYDNNIILLSKSVFKNNSTNAESVIFYKYGPDYLLKEELEFDSLDNLVSHKTFNSFEKVITQNEFDPQFDSKTYETYKYNEQGDISEFTQISNDGNTDFLYFYEKGFLKKKECKWRSRHITTWFYNYNENNLLVSEHLRRKSMNKDYSTAFKIESAILNQYNNQGKLIKKQIFNKGEFDNDVADEEELFINEDEWEGDIMEIQVEYNDIGLISKKIISKNGVETYKEDYIYYN